jgi:hypothetical protein
MRRCLRRIFAGPVSLLFKSQLGEQLMRELICKILNSTEFWSAIIGAIIGGLMVLAAQMLGWWADRKQRREDYKRAQQALAASLLFKMMRIHANYGGVHQYIEESFEQAAKKGMHDEPWRFLLPLASLPTPIDFSSDEMGMLLQQKDDAVFNSMLEADVLYNHFVGGITTLQPMRAALMERIPPDQVSGDTGRVFPSPKELTALRPRMIEVNALIEQLRVDARDGVQESEKLLDRLQGCLGSGLTCRTGLDPLRKPSPSEVKEWDGLFLHS